MRVAVLIIASLFGVNASVIPWAYFALHRVAAEKQAEIADRGSNAADKAVAAIADRLSKTRLERWREARQRRMEEIKNRQRPARRHYRAHH